MPINTYIYALHCLSGVSPLLLLKHFQRRSNDCPSAVHEWTQEQSNAPSYVIVITAAPSAAEIHTKQRKNLYAAVMPALSLKRHLKICMQQLSHKRFPTACQQTTDLHDTAKHSAVHGKQMKHLDTPLFTLGSQEQ